MKEFVTACESKLAQDRKDPFTPGSGLYAEALRLSKIALADDGSWSSADRLQLAEALATWLPQVIDRYDAKDARKKLKLAALRGEA